MRIPAARRPRARASARARTAPALLLAALAAALIASGCGSGGSDSANGSTTAGAVRHFESGPGIERITRDLEAIDEACRVAAGPSALRAARDLGSLIDAGPRDTYGPPSASQTLAQLGRVAAAKASCGHTPELRAALRRLAPD